MLLLSGLRKLFSKKDNFESPNKYKLTYKEKERVTVFFTSIGMVISIVLIMVLSYN